MRERIQDTKRRIKGLIDQLETHLIISLDKKPAKVTMIDQGQGTNINNDEGEDEDEDEDEDHTNHNHHLNDNNNNNNKKKKKKKKKKNLTSSIGFPFKEYHGYQGSLKSKLNLIKKMIGLRLRIEIFDRRSFEGELICMTMMTSKIKGTMVTSTSTSMSFNPSTNTTTTTTTTAIEGELDQEPNDGSSASRSTNRRHQSIDLLLDHTIEFVPGLRSRRVGLIHIPIHYILRLDVNQSINPTISKPLKRGGGTSLALSNTNSTTTTNHSNQSLTSLEFQQNKPIHHLNSPT